MATISRSAASSFPSALRRLAPKALSSPSPQGKCSGCGVCLMFPPGSTFVECAVCGCVTNFRANQMEQITCRAAITNMP